MSYLVSLNPHDCLNAAINNTQKLITKYTMPQNNFMKLCCHIY